MKSEHSMKRKHVNWMYSTTLKAKNKLLLMANLSKTKLTMSCTVKMRILRSFVKSCLATILASVQIPTSIVRVFSKNPFVLMVASVGNFATTFSVAATVRILANPTCALALKITESAILCSVVDALIKNQTAKT